MATYDRAWLTTQIQHYIHDDTTGLEDTFIDIAAKKIAQMLESQANQVTVTYNITDQNHALPDELVSLRAVAYQQAQGNYLLRSVPVHRLSSYQDSGAGGQPVVYACIGGNLKIRPFLSGNYEVTAYSTVDIGSLPTDTNDALTNYPFIFLDAALVEAFDYKQDAEYSMRCESKWLGAVEQVNRVSRKLDQGDSPAMRAY